MRRFNGSSARGIFTVLRRPYVLDVEFANATDPTAPRMAFFLSNSITQCGHI